MLPLILLFGAVLLLAGCAVGPNAAERFYQGVEIGRAARPPVAPVDVMDLWSAARFCIDLWRRRADLRAHGLPFHP